jgi:hypothetical protein
VSDGLDRVFPEPPHEIRGATTIDQNWIDETVEAGSTCCGWNIKPRPPEIDRAPAAAPLPPHKPSFRDRFRSLIGH